MAGMARRSRDATITSRTLDEIRMADAHEFEVVLQPEEEGGFSVFVPRLPGCVSQGETREEALSMVKEAIEVYLESLDAHGVSDESDHQRLGPCER